MAQERARARTTGGALVAAAIVPFMLTAWVPGIARLKTYAIPGSPTMVIAAAPEGNWDLWLIHGDKPDSYTRLTHTPEPERGPSLSPDGRRIVYSSPVGEHDALWIMSLDGNGNPAGTKLLPDSGSDAEEATWSPDGSTILFTQGGPGGSNIHALDIATMRNTALTTDGGALNPAWAPDGSSIAYTKALSNASAIWLMNADGTDRRAAFGGGGYPYAPEWSPDGTKILFTLVGAGTETDVFVANVDGTQVRDLTPGTSSHDVSKGWTPDGQPLFLSNRSNTGGTFLYVMHPDGSDVRLCVIL
jgi:Tol biopolymer transport system component